MYSNRWPTVQKSKIVFVFLWFRSGNTKRRACQATDWIVPDAQTKANCFVLIPWNATKHRISRYLSVLIAFRDGENKKHVLKKTKKQHTFWEYARILLKHHSIPGEKKKKKKTSGFVLQSNCNAFSIRVGHIPELRTWAISGARTVLTPAWTHQMKWTCSASWRRQSRREWKLISGGYWACAVGPAISLTLGGSRDPFVNERLHCHPLMHPIMECVWSRHAAYLCLVICVLCFINRSFQILCTPHGMPVLCGLSVCVFKSCDIYALNSFIPSRS